MTTSDAPTDAIARLEARLAELHEELAALRAANGSTTDAGPSGAAGPAAARPGPSGDNDRPDRRAVLRRTGVMVAGAVAGGTALAATQASPAAAQVFTGSPAVVGNASAGGVGVVGNGNGNDGVQGFTSGAGNSGVLGHSTVASGHGVHGRNVGAGVGVLATTTTTGTALQATSVKGPAVDASASDTGTGVKAHAHNGLGADVSSDGGTALKAVSDGLYGVYASGYIADVRLDPRGPNPILQVGPHSVGELTVDTDGTMWACVSSGSPGTWRRLAGANSTGSLSMLATPVRVYDSRIGYLPPIGNKGKMANGSTQDITWALSYGAANHSTALLLNLTVTNTGTSGFLAAYKYGQAWPGTSSINWDHANQTIANQVTVAVDFYDRFSIYCAGTTDVIIDLLGYYQ